MLTLVLTFNLYHQKLKSAHAGLLLKSSLVHTEHVKASYLNRTVKLWNSLPSVIRMSRKLDDFKALVSEFYCCKMETVFDSSNTCTWSSVCRCHSCVCH